MIRTCPKCGDYYADASLAFCLVDGAPLVDVEPLSESWSEGTRVVEEKGNALRKQKRRLKWRRFMLSALTTLMLVMVVCVVVINSFIYLRPKQEEVALATPLTPTPTPTSTPPLTSTSIPTPSPTPTSTTVYKISGRVTDRSEALGGVNITLDGAKSASTTTDSDGNYTFSDLLTGNYIITPAGAQIDFTPPSRSINNLTRDESADFVATVQPKCSVADEISEGETIRNTFSNEWRDQIIAESKPVGVANTNGRVGSADAEAHLEPIEIRYEVQFPDTCTASVTARWWQVRNSLTGRITHLSEPGKKTFTCTKTGETWRCS